MCGHLSLDARPTLFQDGLIFVPQCCKQPVSGKGHILRFGHSEFSGGCSSVQCTPSVCPSRVLEPLLQASVCSQGPDSLPALTLPSRPALGLLSPVWGDHLGHWDSAPASRPAEQELSEQRAGDRCLSHRGVSLLSGCLTTWQGGGQEQVSSPTSQVSSRSCRPGLPVGWGRWGARVVARTCRFPGKQTWWPLRRWDAADQAAPCSPSTSGSLT